MKGLRTREGAQEDARKDATGFSTSFECMELILLTSSFSINKEKRSKEKRREEKRKGRTHLLTKNRTFPSNPTLPYRYLLNPEPRNHHTSILS
ncbi:hypothetical protein GJ744_001938 [Endocarpon pusillum]|uniref:Uncharacterized protein n=1 Tax=Endocarpon pusillum TaxID=364733 RepID=A0A8H7ANA7_9EURO|nr:hypothetical protein GJ744_001938 [Endocarpon pusillum]